MQSVLSTQRPPTTMRPHPSPKRQGCARRVGPRCPRGCRGKGVPTKKAPPCGQTTGGFASLDRNRRDWRWVEPYRSPQPQGSRSKSPRWRARMRDCHETIARHGLTGAAASPGPTTGQMAPVDTVPRARTSGRSARATQPVVDIILEGGPGSPRPSPDRWCNAAPCVPFQFAARPPHALATS